MSLIILTKVVNIVNKLLNPQLSSFSVFFFNAPARLLQAILCKFRFNDQTGKNDLQKVSNTFFHIIYNFFKEI